MITSCSLNKTAGIQKEYLRNKKINLIVNVNLIQEEEIPRWRNILEVQITVVS